MVVVWSGVVFRFGFVLLLGGGVGGFGFVWGVVGIWFFGSVVGWWWFGQVLFRFGLVPVFIYLKSWMDDVINAQK